MSANETPISSATSAAYEYAWINDYVGVPYRHNGRDRDGWDCWGLVCAVYRDLLGVELPDWRWGEPFSLAARVQAFGNAWDKVKEFQWAAELDAPEPFAIALVLYPGRTLPHHVGVVAGAGVLHAQDYGGTVWEPLGRFGHHYPGVTFWRWHR
jgi:probable lipoprotein NlpC